MKGNIVQFPDSDREDFDIAIPMNEEYKAQAQVLSEFVSGLPLSHADNDRLVAVMVDVTAAATRNGFEQGVRLIASAARDGLLNLTDQQN